jgi:hypothetical protein
MVNGKFLDNGTVTQSKLNLAAPVAAADAARKDYVDTQISTLNTTINTAINNLKQNFDFKDDVVVATTGNITLTGAQTIDGIAVVAGDRVLVKDQTTASANGIYIVSATAWTRATDADTSAKLNTGAYVYVAQGTVNGKTSFILTTTGAITLGTTNLIFSTFSSAYQIVPVSLNRNMPASLTAVDGDKASAIAMAKTPAFDSDVEVNIGGLFIPIGDGVKTKPCYFSGDGGTTARLIKDITQGDFLYWNGSIAGCQLAITDSIDITYSAQ